MVRRHRPGPVFGGLLACGAGRLSLLALMDMAQRLPVRVLEAAIIEQQHGRALGPREVSHPKPLQGMLAQVQHEGELGGPGIVCILESFLEQSKTTRKPNQNGLGPGIIRGR